MPTSQLLQAIKSTLGSTISPSLNSVSDVSDVFEAYVFSLALEAAKAEGSSVTFRDVHGNSPTTFVFRTSPGYIFSTNKPYTHAVIAFPGKLPLEAHLGVRVVGKSGVLHECDVAVLDQIEAETCRQRQVPPRSFRLVIAVECKFYSTPLQLHLARAFIGLTSDLSSDKSIFVTNSASESLERLLTARRKEWEHNLEPSASNEVMRLRAKFQIAYQNYKAR